MNVTKRIRYDSKGNIISETRSGDNNSSISTRKAIEYDENGNIASVKEITEMTRGQEKTKLSEKTTEYKYKNFEGKWMVNKIVQNDKVTNYFFNYKTFIASNGDSVVERRTETYNYYYYKPISIKKTIYAVFELTDERLKEYKEKKLITENFVVPDEIFNVLEVTTTIVKDKVSAEEVKICSGNTDYYCYHKKITHNEDGASVVEDYMVKEDSDDSSDNLSVKNFKSYDSIYTIDKDYNIIASERTDSFLSDVQIVLKDKTIIEYNIESTNDQTGLKFYLKTIEEDREYGHVKTFTITREDGEVIVEKETLESGEVINDSYIKENIETGDKTKYTPIITEYDQFGLQWLRSMVQTTDYNTGDVHRERYLYDNLGRMVMRNLYDYSVVDGKPGTIEGCVVYVYDEAGRVISEVTESTKTDYIYDNDRKIFEISNSGYPMAKEVFDYYYNKIVQSM